MQQSCVNALGEMILDHLTFEEHNKGTVISAKMAGWVLRIFKSRETNPMMTLFKALLPSQQEYCCVLTSSKTSRKNTDSENLTGSLPSASVQ